MYLSLLIGNPHWLLSRRAQQLGGKGKKKKRKKEVLADQKLKLAEVS